MIPLVRPPISVGVILPGRLQMPGRFVAQYPAAPPCRYRSTACRDRAMRMTATLYPQHFTASPKAG